ncbi:hypothetical protein HA052_04240 [Chromobacterium haemolyticum]|uniref:Uncharacterized protein n=1 Tax=Chromobacterium fluminis TaxID=3044269 RepID=A0ABX0L0S2_9NEIS|nr:hypothetical protein [Chromobacterium haemolyticum]NHR04400.1 hypothetical protein [Chromobacterium haemolyticum]
MAEEKRGRGRPATGNAKSSTERGRAADEALKAAGGRIVNRVRLSKEGVDAQEMLSQHYGSDRVAFETALVEWAAIIVARNNK